MRDLDMVIPIPIPIPIMTQIPDKMIPHNQIPSRSRVCYPGRVELHS